jgi:hypothetical protein
MAWAKKACLALILGGLLCTFGCCYHGERFGGNRDVGIGKVGCDTCEDCGRCDPCNNAKTVAR